MVYYHYWMEPVTQTGLWIWYWVQCDFKGNASRMFLLICHARSNCNNSVLHSVTSCDHTCTPSCTVVMNRTGRALWRTGSLMDFLVHRKWSILICSMGSLILYIVDNILCKLTLMLNMLMRSRLLFNMFTILVQSSSKLKCANSC